MTAPVSIALLADDYGIAPGVSRGIRELLQAGRLSGTSCLVVSPHWKGEAPALRGLDAWADIGLHLAFTDFAPLGAMPGLAPGGRLPGLGKLIASAYLGRLRAEEIGQEIDRQLDAFEQAMGRPPDYIDGHQHVQQLPVVRELLIDRLKHRLPPGTALRVCHEPFAAIRRRGVAVMRAAVIAAIGRGLRAMADDNDIASNRRFAGVRDFTERAPYRDLFRRYIADPPHGLATMCHPGYPDDALRQVDPVVDTRPGELAYLAGTEFSEDLATAGATLSRFTLLAAPRTSSEPG
ncbi:MAG: ChbG/HpnK family deacetylase [Rhodospirillales bacterium]|nr:ChbG/HpnK family deacetylase [Rhodospirillales bacterium]